MIRGRVTGNHEAVIPLEVRGTTESNRSVDAVIDTGFTDSLTLPPVVAGELGLPVLGRQIVVLADGSEKELDVCSVSVLWDGQWRQVDVLVADSTPLIGMALLVNYKLHMDIIDGGSVIIESLARV